MAFITTRTHSDAEAVVAVVDVVYLFLFFVGFFLSKHLSFTVLFGDDIARASPANCAVILKSESWLHYALYFAGVRVTFWW